MRTPSYYDNPVVRDFVKSMTPQRAIEVINHPYNFSQDKIDAATIIAINALRKSIEHPSINTKILDLDREEITQ